MPHPTQRPLFAIGFLLLASTLAACGDDSTGTGGGGGGTSSSDATGTGSTTSAATGNPTSATSDSSASTGTPTSSSSDASSSTDTSSSSDSSSATGTGGASSSSSSSTGTGGEASFETDLAAFSGDTFWTLDADEDAEAEGWDDCTYTRHFDAVEDASAPWVCPDCDQVFRASTEVTEGASCYAQLFGSSTAGTEWIGLKDGKFYRQLFGPLTEMGDATPTGDGFAVAYDLELVTAAGGGLTVSFDGTFTESTTIGDPLNGFRPPETYACGWPHEDAPAYTGDYVVRVGETIPDAVLTDNCEEPVRLHHFKGRYLIVEMAAVDCPPCRQMAGLEEGFIEDMAEQGIEVEVITLLAPSLSNTEGTPAPALVSAFVNYFHLDSAVVADRLFGHSIFKEEFPSPAWPTIALVDPDLQVFAVQQGFGSFADFEDAILEHEN